MTVTSLGRNELQSSTSGADSNLQRDVQQDAPVAAGAAADAPAPPFAPIAKRRDALGRFAGPDGASSHYLDAQPQNVPGFYLQVEAAFLEQSLVDDGGREELSARRASQHEYRALVHRRIWQLSDALEARGLLDKRGKLRTAWLQRLESLIGLATKIDATLGLERRAKSVSNPYEYAAAAYGEKAGS